MNLYKKLKLDFESKKIAKMPSNEEIAELRKDTAESEMIFNEIKDSLPDLQFFSFLQVEDHDEKQIDNMVRRKWLMKRIEHLKEFPEKQKDYGTFTMDQIKNKGNRIYSPALFHQQTLDRIKKYNIENYG